MKQSDALNILGLMPDATQDEIKTAYRSACLQYHPDINPAGLEMTQLLNAARDALKDYEPLNTADFSLEDLELNYGEKFNAALRLALNFDLELEVCGNWLWVGGNTREVKDELKGFGFKFAGKKKKWYFRPEKYKSKNRFTWNMDKIRETHGSKKIKSRRKNDNKALVPA